MYQTKKSRFYRLSANLKVIISEKNMLGEVQVGKYKTLALKEKKNIPNKK